MPHKNPFEIPEIVERVALYLQKKDCTNCVRVSKSWRDMFLPRIWRDVEVESEPDVYRHLRRWLDPLPEDVYRHCHLIHSLSLLEEPLGLGTVIYSNLHSLTLKYSDSLDNKELAISVDLTETCPLLTHLEIQQSSLAPATWMALSVHPHIKSLYLASIEVDGTDAPLFWKACENIESLRMVIVSIEGGIPEEAVFDRMRTLEMLLNDDLDVTVQMDLVLQSPMLESLRWQVSQYGESGELSRHPIQSNHWPSLRKIRIYHDLQDVDMASFLTGVGNGQGVIVDIILQRCGLGTQASKILGLHFSTLATVDLSYCDTSARSTVPDILCGCPNLRTLHAKSVFAEYIAERGPWVCQQLRELKICFRVGESQEGLQLQQLVFQRLSTLTGLEKLMMWVPAPNDSDESTLAFRLDCGLGQLASLQGLTTVIFSGQAHECGEYMPQLGVEEVAWIGDHLKKLRTIIGSLDRNAQVASQLRTTMSSIGIRYLSV